MFFSQFFYIIYKRIGKSGNKSTMENPYFKQYFDTACFGNFFIGFLELFVNFYREFKVKKLKEVMIRCP